MGPSKLMREIKKDHWLEKDEEGRFCYMYYFSQLYSANLKPLLPYSFGTVVMHEKMGQGSWGYNISKLSKLTNLMLSKGIKNKTYLNKFKTAWKTKYSKFNKVMAAVGKVDLRFVEVDELLKLLKQLNKAYIDSLKVLIFADGFDLMIPTILTEKLSDYDIDSEDIDLLISSNDLTFSQNEEFDLLTLAKKIRDDKKDKKLGIYRSFDDAWNSSDSLEKYLSVLKKHQQKFFWYSSTYGTVVEEGHDHFFLRLKDLINTKDIVMEMKLISSYTKDIKDNKKDVFKKYKFDKDTKALFDVLSTIDGFSNLRRECSLRANCYIKRIMKELSKRVKIRFELIEYCTPDELETLTSQRTLEKKLKKRIKEIFAVFKESKKTDVYVGATAKHLQSSLEYAISKEQKEVKGVIIVKGFSQGVVKKITYPKDLLKVNDGDIVISRNAQIDLESVIDRVSAIITDEGNYTDNVAILARDNNVPCILGTHVATKILRDNDEVVVDADKGVIKKVKKLH